MKVVSTLFPSTTFFEQRAVIQAAAFERVSLELSIKTNGAVELMNLQLRKITLEDSVF